jgi:hypothetical protein
MFELLLLSHFICKSFTRENAYKSNSYEKYNQITRLSNAHNTFTVGDDKPLPGGFEKGVGNLLPEIP